MRDLALGSLDDYRRYLEEHDEEWRVLDDRCRIVVSHFYRDPDLFDKLRDHVLPSLAANARRENRSVVAVWSAGCACGEEPWTLRVLWDRHVQRMHADVSMSIIATDADARVLARAQQAQYPRSSLRNAPHDWRTEVFSLRDGNYRLDDKWRHGVEFAQQDLRCEMPDGPFDLILCRNLAFTYFDKPLRSAVAEQLRARLRPCGQIVVGAHEVLP